MSYENKVMVMPNGLLVMGPTIFELWVIETEIWVMEIDEPNTPLMFHRFGSMNISRQLSKYDMHGRRPWGWDHMLEHSH